MGFPVQLTQEQFERVATDVVASIVAEAALVMQRKIKAAGYVVSGDLANSLRHQMLLVSSEMYAEFSVGFRGYGRFKDMRQLLYEKMPPVEVMEEFVKRIGLDSFDYVPGYLTDAKRRVEIPNTRAINRIAWGVARSRIFTAKIRHYKRNAFYNPTRGKLIYEASYKLLEALPEPILRAMKQRLEASE
ncbi:hypothetical protein [Rudanella lutea]|uniref:hypothetical protein n=1 Tax=Rudanella lutea TaxID=451374 RepID=UPI00037BEDDE|nr:hypothetical protein [Rudanella lutea]